MIEILSLLKDISPANLVSFGAIVLILAAFLFAGIYFLIKKLLENRNFKIGKDGVSIAYNKKEGGYLISYDDIHSLISQCVNAAIQKMSKIEGLKTQLMEKKFDIIENVYNSILTKFKTTFKNTNTDDRKDNRMTILLFNQNLDSEFENSFMPFLKKVISNTDYQILSSDELIKLGVQTTQRVFSSLDNIIESNMFSNLFDENSLKITKNECGEDIRQYISEAINDSVKITISYNKDKLSILDKLQKEINEYSKDELAKLKGDENIEDIKINTEEI